MIFSPRLLCAADHGVHDGAHDGVDDSEEDDLKFQGEVLVAKLMEKLNSVRKRKVYKVNTSTEVPWCGCVVFKVTNPFKQCNIIITAETTSVGVQAGPIVSADADTQVGLVTGNFMKLVAKLLQTALNDVEPEENKNDTNSVPKVEFVEVSN